MLITMAKGLSVTMLVRAFIAPKSRATRKKFNNNYYHNHHEIAATDTYIVPIRSSYESHINFSLLTLLYADFNMKLLECIFPIPKLYH